MGSYTEKTARYIVDIGYDDIPDTAVEKTKELIVDAIACAMGGVRTELGRAYIGAAQHLLSSGSASVFGTALSGCPPMAAFVNAGLVNALDYDDTGLTAHPGSTVISAAIAVGEEEHVTGKRLIEAIVTAYDVLTTIGLGIEPSWERYLRVHGDGSHLAFGAFSAAAKVLDLGYERTLNGLGIVGALAPVPHAAKFGWEGPTLSWLKDNVAWASAAGVTAAYLAKNNFVGSNSILDGEDGFWIMASSDQCRLDDSIDNLGRFVITEVAVKPYPCCRWMHPALDCLSRIITQTGIAAEMVSRIVVASVPSVALRLTNPRPRTMVDAQFSLPYCLSALLYNIPLAAWHEQESYTNGHILHLASKVEVVGDRAMLQKHLAEHRDPSVVPAKVIVVDKEGRTFEEYSERARGGSQNPLTKEEMRQKFLLLTAEYPQTRLHEVLTLIERLETVRDISCLTALLRETE